VQFRKFFTSTVNGGAWSASRPSPFFLRKGTRDPGPAGNELGGPPVRYDGDRSPLPLPGTEPRLLGRPARSLVAVPNELTQLHSART
jgi:hypothetical protein